MSTKPDSQPPRVRIELLKPHRHAGREYKAGQFLELPEDKADWLIGQGVAEMPPADATVPAKPAAPAPAAAPSSTTKSKE